MGIELAQLVLVRMAHPSQAVVGAGTGQPGTAPRRQRGALHLAALGAPTLPLMSPRSEQINGQFALEGERNHLQSITFPPSGTSAPVAVGPLRDRARTGWVKWSIHVFPLALTRFATFCFPLFQAYLIPRGGEQSGAGGDVPRCPEDRARWVPAAPARTCRWGHRPALAFFVRFIYNAPRNGFLGWRRVFQAGFPPSRRGLVLGSGLESKTRSRLEGNERPECSDERVNNNRKECVCVGRDFSPRICVETKGSGAGLRTLCAAAGSRAKTRRCFGSDYEEAVVCPARIKAMRNKVNLKMLLSPPAVLLPSRSLVKQEERAGRVLGCRPAGRWG